MKKCPYCAEMIQDEAIKCRYCHSDLRVPPDEAIASGGNAPQPAATTPVDEPGRAETSVMSMPAAEEATTPEARPEQAATTREAAPEQAATSPAPAEPMPATAASADASSVRYTHSGYRYVLGYTSDAFGIWDRQSPSAAAERFPRTDDGWRDAWLRFAALEPNHVEVAQGASAATVTASTPGAPGTTTSTADNDALQYTHSGRRYLLGYGQTFFGIWDRQAPNAPVERFSRDDAGWTAAWNRYTALETHFVEVGLGSSGSAGSPA